MYTILVNSDNSLLATNRETIMQRSKMVDKLVFIVDQSYNEISDLANSTVLLEYLRPVSKKYETEILTLSDERYKDQYIQYFLPFNTNFTAEAGDLEIQLTFVQTEIDTNGNSIQRVRKTKTTNIHITPISAWSDIIPDSALSALDQRLIKMDAQIRAMDEMNQIAIDEKADGIIYNNETNELQLTSNGEVIGDKVVIKTGQADDEDGVPVVDFSNIESNLKPDDDGVIEF